MSTTTKPPLYTTPGRRPAFLDLMDDRLGTVDRMAATGEPIVRVTLGPLQQWVVLDPEPARVVLHTEADAFVRAVLINRAFVTVSGTNVFTARGSAWSWRRRTLQPAFKAGPMASLVPAVDRAVTRAVDTIDGTLSGGRGDVADAQDLLASLVLRIPAEALFGLDLEAGTDDVRIRTAFDAIVTWTNRRLANPFGLPTAVPTGHNRRMLAGREAVLSILRDEVGRRRRAGSPGDDMLGQLLTAEDPESKRSLTDDEVLHEAIVMLFAGYETTASSAAWCCAMLATRPELQAAIAAWPEGDDALIDRVVDETLRLYPPAFFTPRSAARRVTVGDYEAAKFTAVLVSTWSIHRNPTYWPDPLRFDPDRFLPAAVKARPAGAFQPFSVGPRLCLGMRLARLELRLIVRRLCQRFELALPAGAAEPAPDPVFSLRIRDGLPLTVTRRERAPLAPSAADGS